ncbi:hypothetical protein P691DRAFT_799153 [Macrolepiota fuliginosa MF-IS2]|uniref:CASTOR ACT domain-containing protein n=1 Tax=Macrolepiota fuliginosa MF-IS2 TaxID=1400762 RepID=A0A9P5X151_9AGAR|nr:hypothetical protein P691DRAFT_799153 [Macrolepiota fuliginosa MF-IS2]
MADAVTISLLPVPLALVHIPRSRLQVLSHPILRHILHPSPTFFNVTANELEISLFVDHEHVQDFDSIARTDRRSQRNDPVEISYEPWSVLQIDSHTDQLDNSGARVNELSAPLAAAGDYTSGVSSPTVLTRSQSTILSPTHSSTPTSGTPPRGSSSYERTKSRSPTSGEVCILDPDLACVGLSDELGVDHWGLKIVKLVAFPELISSTSASSSQSSSLRRKEDISMLFSLKADHDRGEDDGYFSHSPHSISTSELGDTAAAHAESSSSSGARFRSGPGSRPSGPLLSPIDTDISANSTDKDANTSANFTRTMEGSSLTADVKTLAALFPPEERHLLVCCGDLDFDSDLDEGCSGYGSGEEDHEEDVDDCDVSIGDLKCLQIDLRRFGLDKYGLVNKFSRVLGENGVNHMYSSTFKTANLLVSKRHAVRAQALLRGC